MNNIVLISNNEAIATMLNERGSNYGYHLIKTICKKRDVVNQFKELMNAAVSIDTVLIIEGLDDDTSMTTWELAIYLKNNYADIKYVYMIGDTDLHDPSNAYALNQLVKNQIYNIYAGGKVDENGLIDILNRNQNKEEVEAELNLNNLSSDNFNPTVGYNNVVLVSSMKPGSGKTFVATNIALAIARYGQLKRLEDGRMVKPRVAIVDGDLLNLSVGALLRVNNNSSNMATALSSIQQYVRPDGVYGLSDETLDNLTKFIRRCLIPHKQINNLYCMVAPSIDMETLSTLTPSQFFFMMERLLKAFDVIICDSNSSFEHQTTSALFEMCGRALLVCDMDYNNICNNVRYNEKLVDMGYGNKLHYILNKNISYDIAPNCLYDIAYSGDEFSRNGIIVDHKIPLIDANKIKALDYMGKSLVFDDDPSKDISDGRLALLEIANSIWNIDVNRFNEDDSGKPTTQSKSHKEFLGKLTDKLINQLNK